MKDARYFKVLKMKNLKKLTKLTLQLPYMAFSDYTQHNSVVITSTELYKCLEKLYSISKEVKCSTASVKFL